MNSPKLFIAFICIMMLSSCARNTVSLKNADFDDKDFYFLEHSYDRYQNRDNYFQHEYSQINQRRRSYGFSDNTLRPKKTIGLSLSGGGIRSAAFQLGLLSGLHDSKYKNNNLLNRIDYISSVSGGGWANGAYWAWNKNDKFLFDCLDEIAQKGKKNVSTQCKVYKNMLRDEQKVDIIAIEQRKISWENDIINYYLPDCNIDFADKNRSTQCWDSYYKKPYPIFNSTHSISSALDQKASIDKMPFETTPDYMGTIYDCDKSKNGECEKVKTGFFVKNNSDNFKWSNRKRPGKFLFLMLERIPGTPISKAMAHSSGVASGVPILLEYNFDLIYKGNYIDGLRDIYKLSDGGKTENLGLIPLIERGNDLIVISYMGKDEDPLGNPFEDLKLAAKQAKKLFNCNVEIPDIDRSKYIFFSSYKSDNTDIGGDIIHVKPSYENVEEFKQYLKSTSWGKNLADYIEIEKENASISDSDKFPQTKTMIMKYDEKLIQAYYLFGQFIAKKCLSNAISQWLKD